MSGHGLDLILSITLDFTDQSPLRFGGLIGSDQGQENNYLFRWTLLISASHVLDWFLSRSNLTYLPVPTPSSPNWVTDSLLSIKKSHVKLSDSGVGGTYVVSRIENSDPIAIFKPIDEEPGSSGNPKCTQNSFVPLISPGNGAYREVAAYKIDKGFVGVPETMFVEVTNDKGITKRGSLQKFVETVGDMTDFGASKFSVDDVHKLGIFDIRILNMDRNDENILVTKSDNMWKFIPIDHTYTFPPTINSYFNWQYWSQTKQPFSATNLDFIQSIDVLSDASLLLDSGIDERSVMNVMGSTLLLQKASVKGLTLFQIASLVSGPTNDLAKIMSNFEKSIELIRVRSDMKWFCLKYLLDKTITEFVSTLI